MLCGPVIGVETGTPILESPVLGANINGEQPRLVLQEMGNKSVD